MGHYITILGLGFRKVFSPHIVSGGYMGIMEKKMETTIMGYIGFRVYSPSVIDRIWLWVYFNQIIPHILSI